MSSPIMSRFDLFFVVLDECNETTDYNVARHIVGIHRYKNHSVKPEFTSKQIWNYIQFAKTYRPMVFIISCLQ